MKKRKDAIMDSPLRTPTGSGYGSGGEDTDADMFTLKRRGQESIEETSDRLRGRMVFRCRDVGDTNCIWEARGENEEELMPQIEEHGRKAHKLTVDDAMRDRIRQNIKKAA